ncbi:hypothetical protein JOL62DRAFT_558607 [Phyllosticta paracitricarpa]|uniref:C2H2-type domain-containing protein n=2 Tax=Phyllosticta TaxID=121621 RepID=A0ABR1M5R3_9PEZI
MDNYQYFSQYSSGAAVPNQTPQNGPVFQASTYGQPYNQNTTWQPPFHESSRSFEAAAPLMGIPTQQQAWPTPPHQAPLPSIGAVQAHHQPVHNANGLPGVGRPIYMPATVESLGHNSSSALQQQQQRRRRQPHQGHEEIVPNRIEEPEEDEEEEGEEGTSPMERREGPAVRISCPYFLKAPHAEHRSSACRGRAFLDISRLKDHLFKIHDKRLPYRMTGQSTEQKWRYIWRTLFPHDPENTIPSPYWTGIDACQEYVLRFIERTCPSATRDEVKRAFEFFKTRTLPEY